MDSRVTVLVALQKILKNFLNSLREYQNQEEFQHSPDLAVRDQFLLRTCGHLKRTCRIFIMRLTAAVFLKHL